MNKVFEFIKNNYKVFLLLLSITTVIFIVSMILNSKYVSLIRENKVYNIVYFIATIIISFFIIAFLVADLITIYIKHGNVGSKSEHVGGK